MCLYSSQVCEWSEFGVRRMCACGSDGDGDGDGGDGVRFSHLQLTG